MEYMPRRHKQDKESSPNDRVKLQQTSQRLKPHSPITDVQQWLGNTALKQLLTSPNAGVLSLIKQGGNFAALPQLLSLLVQTYSNEEVQTFSDQFEGLTPGQQQAFWQGIVSKSSLSDHIDLKAWQRELEKLSQVELKRDEPMQEGDITQLGAYEPPYNSSYQGLLSPYRSLWQWLNYKGNKQGRSDILLRLDTLSLSAKQLLLHRLVKQDNLSTKTLSAVLSVKEHDKEWVNWTLIEKQLEQLQSLSQEHIEQQLELIQQHPEELEAMEEEQEAEPLAEAGGLPWLALLGGTAAADVEPKREEFYPFHDPEQLALLLLGAPLSAKGEATPLQGDGLINRLLQLEDVAQAKGKATAMRDARIKQLGFESLKALLLFTTITITNLLELHAVTKKDERFLTILKRMQLMKGSALPSKEQLLQALQKQFFSKN